MMDSFTQILLRMLIAAIASSTSNWFKDATPFKVQVKFDIPLFEVQLDANALYKWLSLLEGYLFIHIFSNRKKITFAP